MVKKKHEHGPLYLHAQRELALAGLSEPKGPNEQSVYSTTLRLVDTLERGAKTEYQYNVIMQLFPALAEGNVISQITDNPDEWEELPGGTRMLNRRCNLFQSIDGGVTWIRTDTNTTGVSKKVKHLIEETPNADQEKEKSIQPGESK